MTQIFKLQNYYICLNLSFMQHVQYQTVAGKFQTISYPF
jgi:hypothetical protein